LGRTALKGSPWGAETPGVKESPTTGVAAARAGAAADPLAVVTDLDVAALERRSGIVRGTLASGVLRTNERFLELTGLSAAGARGWDWLPAVHSDDRDRLRRAFEAACRGGARSSFGIRAQLAGNEIGRLRVTVAAVAAPTGEETVFVAAFDRTDTTTAAAADRASETDGPGADAGHHDPFAVLMAALPVPVAYVSPAGTVDYANDTWITTTGVGADHDLTGLLASDPAAAPLSDAIVGARAWTGPARIGDAVAEALVVPIAAADGGGVVVALTPPGTAAVPADADALERLIAPVARLIDSSPDYAAIVAPDGGFLHLNSAAAAVLGADRADALVGRTAAETFTHFVDATTEDGAVDVARLVESGTLITAGEVSVGDTTTFPVALMLYAITDDAGEHRATVVIARDRSDARRASEEIAASQATVNAIVAPAPAGIFAVDADLVVTVWNPACEALFGWSADQVLGGPVPIVREGGVAIDQEAYRARFAAGEVIRGRSRFARRDGSTVVVDLASAPVFDRAGGLVSVVTVAVDMTAADAAEQELEYRAEVDQMTAAIARSLVDTTAETMTTRAVTVLRTLAERSGATAAGLMLHGETEARFRWPADAPVQFDPADGGGAFCCDAVDGHDFHAGWVLTGGAGALGALVLRWPEDPGIEPADLDSLEMITTALVAAADRVDADRKSVV
jgi:PAS domain S-box-containing protein